MKEYNGFSPAQRMKAQHWLVAEWNAGRRARPSQCCACGQNRGLIEAHAEDYSEPFGDHTDAFPLCYLCHRILHCRFWKPEGFQNYRKMIAMGVRFAPVHRENFALVRAILEGTEVDYDQGPAPTRDILGECARGLHNPNSPHYRGVRP